MTVQQAAEVSTEATCHHFTIRLDDEHAIDLVSLDDHMEVLKRWIRQAQECDEQARLWKRRYNRMIRASLLVVFGSWATATAILYVVVSRG